jgi:UDP-N-acetylmuramoylalanine--D-glutamate ligase
MEILHRLNHGRKTIGITGTNGKSTTTALIHHVLNACNHPNQMGGNIGRATLDMEMPPEGGAFVLEISSYQMDLCPTFTPDIAILLNITPDHLDRHGTLEKYEAAKRRIFRAEGQIQIDQPQIDERVRTCDNMKGDHNLQNATAALLACEALGLSEHDIITAIKTFPGLNHRQYTVRTNGALTYINDSKATNAEAAAKSLSAYDNIYWIVGGQAKEGGLSGLEPYASKVKHAFIIGEAQDEFTAWMEKNEIAYTRCETLDNATNAAHDMASAQSASAIILLAPACASWDQFKNFEARGDAFADIVEGL